MNNRHFDPGMRAILLHPERWRLVTPFFPPEVEPVIDGRRRRQSREAASHAPSLFDVLIALRGRTVRGFGEAVYPCAPGTVFVFDESTRDDRGYLPWPPDVIHLWLIITPHEVYGCLDGIRGRRVVQLGKTLCLFGPEEGALLFRDLRAWAGAKPPMPSPVIRLQVVAAIAFIVSRMVALGYEAPTARDRVAHQRWRVDLARRHILQTAGRGASLDLLARLAGYSKYHFLRLFRRHSGESLQAYINDCRLRRVQELLKQGCPMKTIGAELGFSSPSNFSRWYRRFRLPPNAEVAS